MRPARHHGFFGGFASGAVATLLLLPMAQLHMDPGTGLEPARVVDWTRDNLGLSVPVFVLVLVLFGRSLQRLKHDLCQQRPVDEIAHAEQLTDTWTSLFFGVGVIWTAIGMRGALLFALGDPDAAATAGAFAVLQRMVDGGILLALSTTIVGGVGGYLMRIVKTVTVGAALRRYYDRASRAQGEAISATLERIEQHLRGLHEPRSTTEVGSHAQGTLDPGPGNGSG